MQNEIDKYLKHIENDYTAWRDSMGFISNTHEELVTNFNLRTIASVKYIKVVKRDSAHSFIVKEGSGKHKKGDILKAASYNVPIMNFARGNIFDVESYKNITWGGA